MCPQMCGAEEVICGWVGNKGSLLSIFLPLFPHPLFLTPVFLLVI